MKQFKEENETRFLVEELSKIDEIEAITMGGSVVKSLNDEFSDIDLEVIISKRPDLKKREKIITSLSSKWDIDSDYFGLCDEFILSKINKEVDLSYFDKSFLEENVKNVWINGNANNGYTTCFIFTIKNAITLFDRTGWINKLKEKVSTPYPEKLRKNIIERNTAIMYGKNFSSYYDQILLALKRDDFVSVNHRIAAFLSSYFDVIFALNRILNPGEKKLTEYAKKHCSILPEKFEDNLRKLLTTSSKDCIEETLSAIIDELEKVLVKKKPIEIPSIR